jgi:hypothetical protein
MQNAIKIKKIANMPRKNENNDYAMKNMQRK